MRGDISPEWKWTLLGLATAALTGWLDILPEMTGRKDTREEVIIEARGDLVELQAQLRVARQTSLLELKPVLQQIVDIRDNFGQEAWFKGIDPEDARWKMVVLNDSYADRYGVPFEVMGKTGEQLYGEREDMTKDMKACLLRYEINDLRASKLRPGTCMVFDECDMPADNPGQVYEAKFAKCPVQFGTGVFVYGERYKQ